jgi:plastocyanin
MNRTPLMLVLGIAAAGLAPTSTAGAQPAATQLTGSVGPGFTIKLVKGGSKVSSLKPGSYRITVTDKASSHDFHLFGPGVDKKITSVAFKGKKTVTVALESGTYTYQCDPHAALGMRGTFTVAAAPAATTTTEPTTTAPAATTTSSGGYGY